jgi:membrane protease YdiL (CAAX protease family)
MEALFLDAAGRLRTFWRFCIFGFGFLAVQIAVAIVGGLAFVGYLLATDRDLKEFAGDPKALEALQIPLQIIASLPMTLATFGLVFVCRRFLDRRSLGSLGLCRPGTAFMESIWGGLVFGIVPVTAVISIVLAAGGFKYQGVAGSVQTALLVPTFVVMAFFEEIICRGYLLQNLIDIGRPKWGIVFTSTVFWLLHSLNPSAWSSPIVSINLFAAGVGLALAYRVSRNIWFPTAMHFGWNCGQGVLFEVPVSGIRTDGAIDLRLVETAPHWLTGGDFGIEGSIVATVAEIATAAILGSMLLKQEPASPIMVPEQSVFLE